MTHGPGAGATSGAKTLCWGRLVAELATHRAEGAVAVWPVHTLARSLDSCLRRNDGDGHRAAITQGRATRATAPASSPRPRLLDCQPDRLGDPHRADLEHLQSLRVVDVLEQRYGGFDGLNLTFETREGILKHCSLRVARTLGDVGARFVAKRRPSLEAQIANLADEIAYNNHDVDDGLRSGLLQMDELAEVRIFARHMKAALATYPELRGRRLVHETVRRMIDTLVTDLIQIGIDHGRIE